MTQNYVVGLLSCAITKQLSKCITVLLGHVNTEDQGPLEVWSNLSVVALTSLQLDLLNPTERDHGCQIGPGECCVTGREATCIRALVAVLPEVIGGELTGREVMVHACLSQEGIELLLEHLAQETALLNLAPLAEAKKATLYQWTVVHRDGGILSQFLYGQPERSFRDVRLPDIELLIVEPKDAFSDLPTYRLTEEHFEIIQHGRDPWPLPLPMPHWPFAFVYYRRVTITFACEQGTGQPLTPRIVQVLGWRTGWVAGDLVCELGVEEDGSWTVYRRGFVDEKTGEYRPMLEDEFEDALID